MIERTLYYAAWILIKTLQALPLVWVAWIGRQCGGWAYWLDARHRRVALNNLTRCFGHEKRPSEIRALARENFRRLGENYCSSIKTASMSWAELRPYVEFVHWEKIPTPKPGERHQSCLVAIGHFGNFELYARFGQHMPGFDCATTYRALRQPSLNKLLQSLRERSGCLFFERRSDATALKAALSSRPILLGLLADQHAGRGGIVLPFLGHDCSTSTAPAVLALRYHCPLYTGICFRVGLGRWRIETGDEIPTQNDAAPRSIEAITLDINRALEQAVRRDPANWFWVHNRWKVLGGKKARSSSAPLPSERARATVACHSTAPEP